MRTAVIFCAGVYAEELPAIPGDALLIAADGGYNKMQAAGLVPDFMIGDMDSLTGALPEGAPVRILPREKDVTDTDAAVEFALQNGAGAVWLLGAGGGREDHTLANLSLLARLSKKKIPCLLFGPDYTAAAVTDGELDLPARESGTVSVLAWSDVCRDVTISGLKYTLQNGSLTNTFALAVSNEFIGLPAHVRVGSGTLLVMWENA